MASSSALRQQKDPQQGIDPEKFRQSYRQILSF